ncbi:hypothetical protein JW933_01970 [candidate division FCPU426 bacterium]|nr:hypothetical protein [candidate division FCPU426 bacterium]
MHPESLILKAVLAVSAALCLLSPLNTQAREWPESHTATIYSKGTLLPYLPAGGTRTRQSDFLGSASRLECIQVQAKFARHDVALGRTMLVLRSRNGKKVLLKETFTELWECLGYNPRTRRYVLVSQNEHGVKVTLRGLVYLEENRPRFTDSVFARKRFQAAASLYSPEGTYLVLVGAPAGEDQYRLYALDLEQDQLLLLGDAPAPPPLSQEDLEYPEAADLMGPWEAPERHYTELEKEIWSFVNPHTLQVGYGQDTISKRGRKREVRTWNLKNVFRRE